ncbi:hypothetical protein [Flavobacterium ustbae]|uniref:hypothetical protein n=1 Tax=Flavobacterium ustbae TaxID=2488790 RepID=UPI000F7829D0|nr:hypothetical protein [Flavobacterium ustbae]
MSLTNLEGKLTLEEMEEVMAGSGFLTSCAGASVGLALGFAGLCVGGASVIGAGIGAASFIYASAQWGASCR